MKLNPWLVQAMVFNGLSVSVWQPGPQCEPVAIETARQAAATERKARQAETDKLARNVADEAQASGVRSGAGGAVIAKTGERFTALSGESKLHPIVQRIYDSVPQKLRVRIGFHGKCCEGNTTSQMINAGVNPRGATHSVVSVNAH